MAEPVLLDGGGACHASTLAVLAGGDVLVAWFAGSAEGAPDTAIRLARRRGGRWEPSRVVADVAPVAHWNPVLFAAPGGDVHLFFKVGGRIPAWSTWTSVSADGGETWSAPRELVPGDRGGRGPVKNPPVACADGSWIAPASLEAGRWTCFADVSRDGGRTWHAGSPVPADPGRWPGRGLIQPALWESEPGHVHLLARSSAGRIARSDSGDGGRTWTPARDAGLANPNSGIGLAQLGDGRLVLAHNPAGGDWGPRTPLVLSVSGDGGSTWRRAATLAGGAPGAVGGGFEPTDRGVVASGRAEYSYPTVVAGGDGVLVSFTSERRAIAVAEVRAEALGAPGPALRRSRVGHSAG